MLLSLRCAYTSQMTAAEPSRKTSLLTRGWCHRSRSSGLSNMAAPICELAYIRSSMLHGTETWPMTSDALHRLCRNNRAMIRWICGVKPTDDPSMDDLHAKLGICDLAILVRERRLRWFGYIMRSNGEINRVRSRPVPGRKGPGRPKKTWDECVNQDLKVCGLSEAGTQDRVSWRSSVKNSRQEPTPPNRRAPEHGCTSGTARSGDAHPLL